MADPVYQPIIRVALGLFRALDVKLDVRGVENIPASGGGVVVMNHISYLDFALAGVPFWRAGKRLVRFMAKVEVFTHPVTGPLMRGMKHIPVDRSAGAEAYRAAVSALRRGELVGVFPEATISQSYQLKDFKSGAARMAIESGTPAVPVVLWGSQRILTKGHKQSLRRDGRHHPVSVTVGEPMAAIAGESPDAFTARIRAAMQTLLETAQRNYPESPAGEADRWWLPADLGGTAPTPAEAWKADAEEAEAKAARRAQKAAGGRRRRSANNRGRKGSAP